MSHKLLANYLRLRVLSILLAPLAGFVPSASADLLFDHSAGTVRLSAAAGDGDDATFNGSYFVENPYFGRSLLSPFATVSVNGNLYFGNGDGMGDYFLQPLGDSFIDRVAPMWLDLNLGTSGQVIESVTSDYYMVTWLNMESSEGYPGTANFQATFIQTDTTINGMDFLAGDILFSYGEISLYPVVVEVIVGLGASNRDYAALPGYEMTQGVLAEQLFGEVFPVGSDQYVRFRANGSEYIVTIETAIPEPAAYAGIVALLGLGLVALRRHKAC